MKKIDIKDVFSWSNAEDAKKYIGKYCYFADKLCELENQVKKDKSYKLQRVSQLEMVHSVFLADDELWGLCLPADKVKEVEEEKQYRPFTADEFLKLFKVGDVIGIKHPNAGEVITLITSIRKKTNELTLGSLSEAYSFKRFFESGTEIFLNNQWQPFGVAYREGY